MIQAPVQPKYEIKGQPLIAVPEIFQLIYNELGRDAVRLMNERYAGNNKVVLDISSLAENQPIGFSNPYRRFALGPIIRELYGKDADGKTLQLLTPALSELALRHDTLPDARSTYEDLAVVVYSIKGANAQLARHLVDQARGMGKVKFPVVIYGLQTVKDDSFPNGLRFDLGDIAVAYHIPILSRGTRNFDAFDPELVKTGFPGKLGDGSRTLYTANDGLRRVSRLRDLNLDANYGNLVDSYVAGRVSFVRGKAPQNLEAALGAIEAEVRRQEKDIGEIAVEVGRQEEAIGALAVEVRGQERAIEEIEAIEARNARALKTLDRR